jgi:hypothetical protein
VFCIRSSDDREYSTGTQHSDLGVGVELGDIALDEALFKFFDLRFDIFIDNELIAQRLGCRM